MRNKIHIWQLPSTKIYVLLESIYRNEVISDALEKAKKLRIMNNKDKYRKLLLWLNKQSKRYGINSKFGISDIQLWNKGSRIDHRTDKKHPKYMPLWVAIELTKFANHNLKELERKVTSYRLGGKGGILTNLKLPIKITPELDTLIVNLICDGSYYGTPKYFNTDAILRKNFLQKIRNCFGDFEYKSYEDGKHIRIPGVVGAILKHFYKVESFHSLLARLPKKLFEHSLLHKFACLLAYIADDGSISEMIYLNSSNRPLLEDARKIGVKIKIKCNPIRRHSKHDREVYFTISRKSLPRFLELYNRLKHTYPTVSLGRREHDLDKLTNLVIPK